MKSIIYTPIVHTPLKSEDGTKRMDSEVSNMEVDTEHVNKMCRLDQSQEPEVEIIEQR